MVVEGGDAELAAGLRSGVGCTRRRDACTTNAGSTKRLHHKRAGEAFRAQAPQSVTASAVGKKLA